jgi:hypothetical protein
MKAHALLGASRAHKWLNCTPSAVLEASMADTSSEYAAEGTLAHAVAESMLKGREVAGEEELLDYVRQYVDTVDQLKGQRLIEQRVSFADYAPGGFGTCDAIVCAGTEMHILDLKYGQGVPVYAKDNPQLRFYALGALDMLDWVADFKRIHMWIVQPRLHNITRETLTVKDITAWGESIKPYALMASKGEGKQQVGDWCQFCKARAVCSARRERSLQALEMQGKTITLDNIREALGVADTLVSWAKDVKTYALKLVLEGVPISGYKLVEGRTTRRYKNPIRLEGQLRDAGYAENVFLEKKLKGLGELKKALGAKVFKTRVEPELYTPDPSPTLVPDTDPRTEWLQITKSDFDFEEEY